ncbi:hypothetical protein BGX31_002338 [Mortierella sp. GBA43]|nr:hypothetical protein BGX31_002338 [Mortierella sp. GBA43]
MFRILLSESAINRQDLAGIPNPRAALRSTELFTPTNTQASSYGAYLGFSFVLVEIKKPGASGDELEGDSRKLPCMGKLMVDPCYSSLEFPQY